MNLINVSADIHHSVSGGNFILPYFLNNFLGFNENTNKRLNQMLPLIILFRRPKHPVSGITNRRFPI